MNLYNTAGLIVLTCVVAPIVAILVAKAVRHFILRQRIKRTPGPLLGVLYPERFEPLTTKDNK